VGHLDRVAAIRHGLGRHPGLTVCGTSYDGTSFNHAVAAGTRAGRDLAAYIKTGVHPARSSNESELAAV